MPRYSFVTVDVFTTQRFGGNPLAVFPRAHGLSEAQMQALAREFNLSETTFVLPPEDPANTARVRIFTPAREMPFAGHPNVGTGWVLAREGRATSNRMRFEEISGLVEIVVEGDQVTIAAPQPLSFGAAVDPSLVAACIGCDVAKVLTGAHAPMLASTGNPFFFAEVAPDALTHASPDIAAFRAAAAAVPDAPAGRFALHIYARAGETIRTRMFAPPLGVLEDPATGSANVTLGALLLHLSGEAHARYVMTQGAEMGRPSTLHVAAQRGADGIRATVGGACVPVLRGEVEL
jgi:trans-2,3-dihydro-3-hydroxyanthranilate isomerase